MPSKRAQAKLGPRISQYMYMWIKLDFTPLFVDAIIAGLILIAVGIAIRFQFPNRSVIGVIVIVAGLIPALAGGILLGMDKAAKWTEARRNRRSTETLTESREIQGIHIPRGSVIERTGELMSGVTLGEPARILGVEFQGKLTFNNTLTNGYRLAATELDTGTLVGDHTIDAVPCRGEVEFFREGGEALKNGRPPAVRRAKLKRCTLSAEFEFAGNRYMAASQISFNYSGGVGLGVLAEDQTVDGYWCQGGTEVERPTDRAIRFTPAKDEGIVGIACKAGHEVRLEPSQGKVMHAVLARDQEIDGVGCRADGDVTFEYKEGAYPLDSCVLSRAHTLLTVEWPAGSTVKGLSMTWLEVTLPAGAGVRVGDVALTGPCRLHFDQASLALTGATALDRQRSSVEFRGARFEDYNTYQGSGWGHLAVAGTFEGTAYQAGDLVRFAAPDVR